MSVAQEAELGMRLFPAVIQHAGGEVPDLELQGYVQRVGERVAQAGSRPGLDYQFRVVNDPVPNAFALPGGYVVVTRGLLMALQDEAQLAALLGHEVAHVTAGHALRMLDHGTQARLSMSLLAAVDRDERTVLQALQAGELGRLLLEDTCSREQERDADRLGIEAMAAAGYDPLGAIDLQELFLRKLEQEKQPEWIDRLFRTHPFSRERLEASRRHVGDTYAGVAAGAGGHRGEDAFASALRYVRETEEGYRLYGEARAQEADHEELRALDTYLEAIKAAPMEAYLVAAVGIAYLRQGDLITSRRYLRQAISLDSDYYQSYLALGYLHVERKEYAQAVPNLERSLELLATSRGGYLLGEALAGSGEVARARTYFTAVVDADPRGKMGQAAAQRLVELGGN